MRKPILLSTLLAALLLAAPLAQAKLYKWVDEKGVTHVGDSIPPQYADQARTELSKDGRVVKQVSGPLTPEQLKAREEEQAKQQQAQQDAVEQKRRDNALINTYSKPEEIDLARDRNLQQADLTINGIQMRIKSTQARQTQYQQQADRYNKAKRPVPADLQSDLQDTNAEMKTLQEMLKQKQQEKATIRARYDADKKRFMELTGRSNAPAQ